MKMGWGYGKWTKARGEEIVTAHRKPHWWWAMIKCKLSNHLSIRSNALSPSLGTLSLSMGLSLSTGWRSGNKIGIECVLLIFNVATLSMVAAFESVNAVTYARILIHEQKKYLCHRNFKFINSSNLRCYACDYDKLWIYICYVLSYMWNAAYSNIYGRRSAISNTLSRAMCY